MKERKIDGLSNGQRHGRWVMRRTRAIHAIHAPHALVPAGLFVLFVSLKPIHAQQLPQPQRYEVQRGGTVDQQSLRFVPFLRVPAKEQTMRDLVTAVEGGAYTGVNPSTQVGEQFMASAWAALHAGDGMPNFGNSSQAHIFSTNLLMVVQDINSATWGRVSNNPPQFGAEITDYRQAPMFGHQMRNLLDPYTLQFCSNRAAQCADLLQAWVHDIGEASMRGAKRLQKSRLGQWHSEQQALAEQERQRQAQLHAEQTAKEQAKNNAVNADIAAQAARIRAQQNRAAASR